MRTQSEHPLINEISSLTLDEIQHKISDLNKKLAFAYGTGNQAVIHQLTMLMNSHQEAYRVKIDEAIPKDSGDKFGNIIDIS